MKWCSALLSALALVGGLFAWPSEVCAQPASEHHQATVETNAMHTSHGEQTHEGWEGSDEGIAYSEFNHRFIGLLVFLFGLSELAHAVQLSIPFWTRLVLPSALGVIGVYLLVWSDHQAWPIGTLGFMQTFSGEDPEILQHKFYGVFSSTAAVSETLRRIGWARHPAWAVPLFVLGLGGALLLFIHSHGDHPADHMIALHHALLGSFGIGAAVSNALVAWASGMSTQTIKKWELAWAGFVIIIGLQLLVYFE